MSDFPVIPKRGDWYERLDRFVVEATAKPFVWGVHDCALFAADAVQAQTGADYAADLRGRYDSLESGLTLLRSLGYLDHVALAAASLPEIPVAMARLGDVAAVELGSFGMSLTIVGGHHLTGPMPGMRGVLPLTSAYRAFAVGRQP